MKTKFLKRDYICILLFVVLLFVGSVQGQDITIDIILSPTLQNAQVVYLSNFDFLQVGSGEFLFQVTINNMSGAEIDGILEFEVNKNGDEIASANTDPVSLFSLPTGISTFNNIQLSNGYVLSNGSLIKFDDQDITTPDDQFEDEVYQSGTLPGGDYTFLIAFKRFQGDPNPIMSPPQVLQVITAPYVLPIAPGTGSDLANPDPVYTEFPIFQFTSNLTDPLALFNAPFRVQVFKKLEQHNNPDEVLSSTPHLDFQTNSTLFQYPQIGEQPLEPATYLWRVILTIQTTNGTEEITSPLYAFKVVDPTNASEDLVGKAATEEILRLLRFLIGNEADAYADILSNYKLVVIKLNGETVEATDLYNKIASYEGKVLKISDIELLSSQ